MHCFVERKRQLIQLRRNIDTSFDRFDQPGDGRARHRSVCSDDFPDCGERFFEAFCQRLQRAVDATEFGLRSLLQLAAQNLNAFSLQERTADNKRIIENA